MTAPPPLARSLTSHLARTSVVILAGASVVLLVVEWAALSAVIRSSVTTTDTGDVRTAVFQMTQDVIVTVLVVSAAVLAIITLLAGFLIRHVARRSLRRVAEVTALARSMTTTNMDHRLHLQGADDELKELGDTFDSMLDRLAEAFERQDRFIANASHELRTPVTVVRTALESAVQRGNVPPSAQPAVDRSLKATLRLNDILDALLHLARARALTTEFRHPVEVAGTARVVLDEIEPTISAGGLRVTSTLEECWVDGDQVLIMQAIHNLVDNAIRHNDSGGAVRVDVGAEPDVCVIRIENTGPIVPAAVVPRLVEAFHRGVHTRRTHETSSRGAGLGLSIVDTIVRQHSGQLMIAPRPAGGLIVSIRMPLLDCADGRTRAGMAEVATPATPASPPTDDDRQPLSRNQAS